MVRRRRRSTLFPYTTLFRSVEPQREQGVDRERRVPYPGVAVVPVALAADLLGQAGRRCRDEAAGGGVGQELERDRRSVQDRKSTRLNSSHVNILHSVLCLKN